LSGEPPISSYSAIRRYREEAERKRDRDPEPKPAGFYGPNSNGLFDLAGNVWEWTSTCYFRATLTPDRAGIETIVENCGVHVMEGRHRAYMSNFIRDGKSGGCAVGTPPENLGFRLVRERPPLVSVAGARHHLRAALQTTN
jgi:formylglycine-generating enzyme required for sulfatase activity